MKARNREARAMRKSGVVVVLLFVCGHAIRVVGGHPARAIRRGCSRLDQTDALKLAAEQCREVGRQPKGR